MSDLYLFDTYALVEIIRGGKNYQKYVKEKIVINDFIFAELSYVLFRSDYPQAELAANRYARFIVPLQPNTILKAMAFRFKHRKKRLSMTDAISYIQAKQLGIRFLTGDKEFERLENVEFVQA